MKSKKWLISLGLAVVLVVAFALPACETTPTENWYTPEGDKISFEITAISGTYNNIALMVAEDLQDLGMDVTVRVLDTTTYYEYLYEPNLGGMEAFSGGEDPSPDPWSDWIWMMLADPEDYGYLWNPCWYYDEHYDELMQANYLAPNISAKEEIILELQEILAEDLPVIFIARENLISVYREDNWTNWYNELGGPVTWINDHNMREVTAVGDATQLNIGTLVLMSSLNVEQDALQYTNAGCLYLMMNYECPVFFPKVGEDLGAAYDFVPRLATYYDVSYEVDGTGGHNQVWTVDMRDDVKWHDGENLTADDWVYTLQYAMARWATNRPVNWTAVEENEWEILPEHMLISKTSDYQVQLRYIEGYHQNSEFFPTTWLWYAIVPEHVFGPAGNGTQEGWMEDPMAWDGNYIGTGPYKVLEWEVDQYLLFERNDDYWGPLPEPEQILFKLYADYGAMWLALEAGEIDATMGSGAPFAKYDAYVANEDLTVEVEPDLTINYLGFNLHPTGGYEPLLDLALRQAIAAAINKQNIVDVALGGYGETADSWTYNESPFHHPSLPNNEYDTTEATNILLAANYTFHE